MEAAPREARVREATAEDWPAVAALLAELGRPEALGRVEEPTLKGVFLGYLERPDEEALVAEVNGRVVGFVDIEYRTRLNFDRPQAWIPDLVVAEADRSRGVGRALLCRAEELARERGCWGISLESATWRTRAHAFYLREGWTDAGKGFTKSLTGEPWPPAPPDGG
ncbi:MAG: GNAT family N-acetyltransferase [Actinomycetota bacterium]